MIVEKQRRDHKTFFFEKEGWFFFLRGTNSFYFIREREKKKESDAPWTGRGPSCPFFSTTVETRQQRVIKGPFLFFLQ